MGDTLACGAELYSAILLSTMGFVGLGGLTISLGICIWLCGFRPAGELLFCYSQKE